MELVDFDVNKRNVNKHDLGSGGEIRFELSPEPTNHIILLDLKSISGVLDFCTPIHRKS